MGRKISSETPSSHRESETTVTSGAISASSSGRNSQPSHDDGAATVVKRAHVDPLIFGLSTSFILLFVAATLLLQETAANALGAVSGWLLENLNWLFIGGVSIAFLFLAFLFVSRYGRMRLGQDGERPEHSNVSWFAMLFAGGLGSVLMFWGVAEPLNHMTNVPMANEEPGSLGAIKQAMGFTMYHFGLNMWVVFALPGLGMGYFIYKRSLPPRLSSIFAPILGGAIYKWPGKLIDALAIVGTVFGIAVSVGLGVLQINSGLAKVFGAPTVAWVQIIIIAVIVGIACLSVAAGLNKGIKFLSNLNILMAAGLMIFVLLTGPTLFLLRGTFDAASLYAEWLPKLMFWTDAMDENPGWQGSWTVFYWAWTICWSPFMGMFLARISRGRTVREFIGGALLLPVLFSMIWFSIFGFAGVHIEREDPGALSGPVVHDGDTAYALFGFLEYFPMTTAVSIFALAVVAIFFITSIDSAALVTDMFSSGEEDKTPTLYRVGWAIAIGAVAGSILIISPDAGIDSLQHTVIIIGFPFFLVNFVLMYSIVRGMKDDLMVRREPITRQWERTDTAEKLEAHESKPAPGYDQDGNELPRLEYDDNGQLVIPGNVLIEGDLGVVGDVDEDAGPSTPADTDD
ncbi:Glycine betaine transporter OpuD [Corynebacterium urogenitale]|uniref:Glycine betaine transporter OpuD n=1 Tax=Corynebacterium urogenitale TaxID=2487892 RepID=A0A5J6ZAQ4_9CORY|nr:Glycine betaine transporter OpuD [Corynebacterium urogenitale]